MNDKWDDRFLRLAEQVAEWSKDPSTKVGAVVVDEKRRVIGVGYNGFARGVQDRIGRLSERTVKYDLTVHAELNAILNCSAPTAGSIVYVTQHPCARCAALLIQAGVAGVVCPRPDRGVMIRWGRSFELAVEQFSEAGVWMKEI